jgi:hypothetical protein
VTRVGRLAEAQELPVNVIVESVVIVIGDPGEAVPVSVKVPEQVASREVEVHVVE